MKRPKPAKLEPLQKLGVVSVNYDIHVNELNEYIDYLERNVKQCECEEGAPVNVKICTKCDGVWE